MTIEFSVFQIIVTAVACIGIGLGILLRIKAKDAEASAALITVTILLVIGACGIKGCSNSIRHSNELVQTQKDKERQEQQTVIDNMPLIWQKYCEFIDNETDITFRKITTEHLVKQNPPKISFDQIETIFQLSKYSREWNPEEYIWFENKLIPFVNIDNVLGMPGEDADD